MKNLYEYIAVNEGLTVKEAKEFILGLASCPTHEGDCNNKPQPCSLCTLETVLMDYSVYCSIFQKDEYV